MKENTAKNGKKIAGLALTAVLVVGSLGTAAALAANGSDAVPKDTVMSASASISPSDTAAVAQGTIQYSKDVYARADGSQDFTMESWYNPETKDLRSDLHEYSPDHQLIRYQSTYYVNSGNDLIIIQRDANGNPTSGTIMKRADQPTIFTKYEKTNHGYNGVKDYLTGGRWTSIGTEQTADGKTLNKLMSSYQSYISDTTQANMQLIEFVDQDTGLPVKEELYEDSTGQYKLFSTDISEYKYVTDDGMLFKPGNITLTSAPGPSVTLGK
ncbi:hypothetical protein SAMN02745823_01167 [Sporobacter termitidis DSM 10068]|uniref:DUF3298 domain-containing protein n=1 Tax=Sporobacter termitidis DSM 10068 TaxID=1123282 RepID=A0A1M5WBX1_9FIRM|nr:hypothetical protein [Sporobacter termitidis]SHH84694.1 hypothetical protein SAMN02745823_01167 [Sporobacter termitidis DSM 10068]